MIIFNKEIVFVLFYVRDFKNLFYRGELIKNKTRKNPGLNYG
jgi:hypothetical protein